VKGEGLVPAPWEIERVMGLTLKPAMEAIYIVGAAFHSQME
jgi:hypothetical protein